MDADSQEIEPRWIGPRPKPAQTRIANGAKLLLADGRSTWSKRFREIVSGHVADLGGIEVISAAELAILKRCATIEVELEYQETRLANGDSKGFDLATFAQVANGLRRLLETVGIKRVARDCTPSLAEVIARHHNDAELIEARAEQACVDEMVEQGCNTSAEESSIVEEDSAP